MATQFTLKGTLIWILCAIFFLYEFMLRTIVGTFQHPIMYDLDLSIVQFSTLSSTAYLLIYGMMQIPVGIIIDRIGLKLSLTLGCSLCALSCFGFSLSQGYLGAMVCRFLTGLGSSFGFICLLVSVYEWLPKSNRTFLIGLSIFLGTLGPMFAGGPLEALTATGNIEWRFIFQIMGYFGAILTLIMFIFTSNNNETQGRHVVLKRPESILKTITHIFSKPQALWIAAFSSLVYFMLEYLSENEGKLYLITKGFTAIDAAYMFTISWLGYAIGCPLIGWFSDITSKRRPSLIFAAIMASLSLVTIVGFSDTLILRIAFFCLGVGASGVSLSYATMSEQFQKPYLAAGLSLNNGIIVTVSALNAPFIGYIMDTMKTGEHPVLSDYTLLFSGLSVVIALSIPIALFLIKETFCKSAADFTYIKR